MIKILTESLDYYLLPLLTLSLKCIGSHCFFLHYKQPKFAVCCNDKCV